MAMQRSAKNCSKPHCRVQSSKHTRIADGQVRMMGLALDSLRQKLYYTDEGNDAKIAEISTDGRYHRVVLRMPRMKPRAVVLYDQHRLVAIRTLTWLKL